jgi:sigma-B regulation protein RsbU (phosphoserine phosphatase)
VLGLLKNSRFRQMEISFYQGDLLVLYSDGIVEATNQTGEEFGEERLCAALARCAGATAAEARGEILREYRRFLNDAQPEDDVTLLVLEAKGCATREKATERRDAGMVAA